MSQGRASAVVSVFLLFSACDYTLDFHGTVTNCANQRPLVGVRIRLAFVDFHDESFSDQHGEYVTGTLDSSYAVMFHADKPNYRDFKQTFGSVPNHAVNFCLEPLGGGTDGGVDGGAHGDGDASAVMDSGP